MAQLKITSNLEGLTPSEAKQRAAKYPHAGKPQHGPQIDGDAFEVETLDLSRRWLITPDNKAWTVPDGNSMWSDPRTSEIVRSFEKDYLYHVRKKAEKFSGDIRLTGRGAEYDRYVFSLSKEDAAKLGPEGVEKALKDFVSALRTSPWGSGSRMLEVEPVHQTEEGHIHIHVTAHRHAVDMEAGAIRKGIVQGEIHDKEAERIIGMIDAPIVVEYPMGGGRGFSEEVKEAAAETIREAGGQPSPELAGVRESAAEVSRVPAEIERLERAKRELEARIAKRHHENTIDAALMADLQSGLTAVQERDEQLAKIAEQERILGEREAEVEALTAQVEEIEKARAALIEDLSAMTTRAETVELAHAVTTENLAEKTEEAERLSGELTSTMDALTAESEAKATAEAEVARLAEQNESLANELAEAETVKERLRDGNAKLTEDLHNAVAERDDLARRIAAAEEREAKAIAALDNERATFADRAAAWAEANVAGPLRVQINELKSELAQAKEFFATQIATLTAGLQSRAPAARTSTFVERDPSQWTAQDRAVAQEAFARAQAAGKFKNLTLEEWGSSQHNAWRKKNPDAGSEGAAGHKPRQPE